MDQTIYYRNKVFHAIYTNLLKPFFFKKDPESVHDQMTKIGTWLGSHSFSKKLIRDFFDYKNPFLEQEILGVNFKNPVGLSAGFDKNAELTDILPSLGFGFAEVGSITNNPYLGNPKPRLWRLPKSKSLVVYFGLKNEGCKVIAEKIKNKKFDIPIGINIAVTNCKENLDTKKAVKDFANAFKIMKQFGSYTTVNISCPNTFGGQPFMMPYKLDYLFDILDEIPTKKPIFIKLSPDLSHEKLDELLNIARLHRIDGIICTNLTKIRTNPKILDKNVPDVGGMSGGILKDMSDELLSYIYKKEGNRFVLIGSGGVFNAEDAYRKIRLGASMVQMITGMIFEGPQVISEINQGIVKLLKRDGFNNIKEAIGVNHI